MERKEASLSSKFPPQATEAQLHRECWETVENICLGVGAFIHQLPSMHQSSRAAPGRCANSLALPADPARGPSALLRLKKKKPQGKTTGIFSELPLEYRGQSERTRGQDINHVCYTNHALESSSVYYVMTQMSPTQATLTRCFLNWWHFL